VRAYKTDHLGLLGMKEYVITKKRELERKTAGGCDRKFPKTGTRTVPRNSPLNTCDDHKRLEKRKRGKVFTTR